MTLASAVTELKMKTGAQSMSKCNCYPRELLITARPVAFTLYTGLDAQYLLRSFENVRTDENNALRETPGLNDVI